MLISSFKLENGIIISPLHNFYLSLALKCQNFYRLLQYTPKKFFNNFVQSVLDARRSSDKNPDSIVAAATMNMLVISSLGYQIMDRSRHTKTMHLNNEQTLKANIEKMFKRLKNVSEEIYEVQLVNCRIEHRESVIIGLYISKRLATYVGASLQLI